MSDLLFVYGRPCDLAAHGAALSRDHTFRYWIALDIDDAPSTGFLKPTHRGLLLFTKLGLKLPTVRIPHANCTACHKTLKDWGGKKHLMHPQGAALSDVWRDLPRRRLGDQIPADVRKRIEALSGGSSFDLLWERPSRREGCRSRPEGRSHTNPKLRPNQIHRADCIKFLKKLPDGVFDLCFADPPYNLEKNYGRYDDLLADQRYLDWCNQWLGEMARTLKPGGSLFVLNLPKWAMHHAAFLNDRLDFRHWIAWDALSDPRGKIMPAHYALLYYTKPGATPVFHSQTTDSPRRCFRAKCIKERTPEPHELTDIWFDIHRIRHKRDRDAHPCQLPEKLMERILRLTTNPGALVFDPFCGAGTTALVAQRLGRQYIVTDLDPKYVAIAKARLTGLQRVSTRKAKPKGNKRAIEQQLQALARQLRRVPVEADLSPDLLKQIDAVYPYRSAALKRARLGLA